MRNPTATLALAALCLPACSLAYSGGRYTGGDPTLDAATETDGASATDAGATDAGATGDAGGACGSVSCGPGQRCFEGACFDPCTSPAECMPDQMCTVDGRCVERMPCDTSIPCGMGFFCDEGSCVQCDVDGDGFANERDEAGACLQRRGDCADGDPGTFPFAPPDCDRSTRETCGSGMGLFSPDNFEIGVRSYPNVVPVAAYDVHAFPLAPVDREARILVLYRTGVHETPQFVIATLGVAGLSTTPPRAIPDSQVDELIDSRFTAVRRAGGGVVVASVDRDTNSGFERLTLYTARFDGEEWQAPTRRTLESVLAGDRVVEIRAIAATNDLSGAPELMAVLRTESDGDRALLLGLDTTHMEDATDFLDPGMEIARGHSSAAGALFERTGGGNALFWDGTVGPSARSLDVDTGTTLPAAFASGVNGARQFAVVFGPTAVGQVRAQSIDCMALPGSCAIGINDLVRPFTDGLPSTDLAADHLGGTSIMLARRTSASVTLAGFDAETRSITAPLEIPFDAARAWNQLGLRTLVAPSGGVGSATVVVTGRAADRVDLVALRACFEL